MCKLKITISAAGILLLILSAASLYVAMRELSRVHPAEDYEDQGVLTFLPYDVLPVQVQNTGANGRDRRMNPTRTVYMVYYRAADGSGYQWSDEVPTRDLGEKTVETGETVERRVLRIPEDRTYITVEPEQTAESYVESIRRGYTRIVGFSVLYIFFYLDLLLILRVVHRLRKRRAEPAVPEQSGPEIVEPRRSQILAHWSGWHQEPGGVEVYRPSRFRERMVVPLLLLLAAVLLLALKETGSSDPVDLDYGWSGSTWHCDELELRFDLPAEGVIYDTEERQKVRERTFGHRGSAGQTVLTVTDPDEGSNLDLLVVRTDPPAEDFLLNMVTAYALSVDGAEEPEPWEDLTVGGHPWRAWRIDLPEQGRACWYLYRQEGEYALSITSSGPMLEIPPAILACFQE